MRLEFWFLEILKSCQHGILEDLYIKDIRYSYKIYIFVCDDLDVANDRPPNVLSWIYISIALSIVLPLTGIIKYKKLIIDILWINSSYPTTTCESTRGATTCSSPQVWQRAPSLLDDSSTAVAVSPQCAYAIASLRLKEMIFVGDFKLGFRWRFKGGEHIMQGIFDQSQSSHSYISKSYKL